MLSPAFTNRVFHSGAFSLFPRASESFDISFSRKLCAPNRATHPSPGFQFGFDIAIHGDTLVIGASTDGYDANDQNLLGSAGAVYIFVRTGPAVWTFQQKLCAPIRVSSDLFGQSVTIEGDTLAVGAPQHDFDVNHLNSVSNAGAVYIFKRTAGVWTFQQKLVPVVRIANDRFGTNNNAFGKRAISLSGDSIAIASRTHPLDENDANSISGAGAGWVFTRSADVWSLQRKFADPLRSSLNPNFADSCVLSGDTVAFGSAASDNVVQNDGAVIVFTRSVGVWSHQQRITHPNPITFDALGSDLAMVGEFLFIGCEDQDYDASDVNLLTSAGAVYVYKRSGVVWSFQQKLVAPFRAASARFGHMVRADGDTLVIGSYGNSLDEDELNSISFAGAAYIFRNVAEVWTLYKKICQKPTRAASRQFGRMLAVYGDIVAVGVPAETLDESELNTITNAGAVCIYE